MISMERIGSLLKNLRMTVSIGNKLRISVDKVIQGLSMMENSLILLNHFLGDLRIQGEADM